MTTKKIKTTQQLTIENLSDQKLIDAYERLLDLNRPKFKLEEMEKRLGEIDNHPYQRFAQKQWEADLLFRYTVQEQQIKSLTKALIEAIEELHPLQRTDHRDIVVRACAAMELSLEDTHLYLKGELIL